MASLSHKVMVWASCSAIGVLIGSEISARTGVPSLWLVGLFLGASVGYLLAGFRQVLDGFSQAYRDTINWRPYGLYWRAYLVQFLAFTMISLTVITGIVLVVTVISIINSSSVPSTEDFLEGLCVVYVLVWPLVSTLVGLAFSPVEVKRGQDRVNGRWVAWSDEKYEDELKMVIDDGWDRMLKTNPVGVLYRLPRGIWWVLSRAVPVTMFVASLLWQLGVIFFAHIHTKERVTYFVGIATSCAIGHYCGSAIIGALAGAALACVDHIVLAPRAKKLAARYLAQNNASQTPSTWDGDLQ